MSPLDIGDAHAVKIEALARLGELLAAMPKNRGAQGIGTSAVPDRNNTLPPYPELGLDRKTAMVAQQLAALPAATRPARGRRPAPPGREPAGDDRGEAGDAEAGRPDERLN